MVDDAIVTAVVVNWNGRRYLKNCLDSLSRQSSGVIMVDNGSTDGSSDYVSKHFPKVKIIQIKINLGFAKANNIAIKQSRSKYVALINNDAFAEPDWLEKLVHALENNPEAGMAASKMVYDDNPEIIDRAGDGYSLTGAGILRGRGASITRFDRPERIFGACAGAALYRREMLEEIGLFDEDFFLLYEDVDLSFRAQSAGYQCIYVPDAVARHKASRTIGRDSDTSVYYGHRNIEWAYVKNMPMPLMALTIMPHLVYILLAGVYFISIGKGRAYIRAKKDALKGLGRMLDKRREIQKNRKVSLCHILGLMTAENPFKRLGARFRD